MELDPEQRSGQEKIRIAIDGIEQKRSENLVRSSKSTMIVPQRFLSTNFRDGDWPVSSHMDNSPDPLRGKNPEITTPPLVPCLTSFHFERPASHINAPKTDRLCETTVVARLVNSKTL